MIRLGALVSASTIRKKVGGKSWASSMRMASYRSVVCPSRTLRVHWQTPVKAHEEPCRDLAVRKLTGNMLMALQASE